MNITYVTGIHGDEIAPIIALASIGERFLIANPLATVKGRRFIEMDMNQAFGVENSDKLFEQRLADELLTKIPEENYVIDFHTFSAVSEPFAVVVDDKMIGLASTLGVDHVVYMKHNIKNGHALINYRDGISIEVGSHQDIRSMQKTIQVVNCLKTGAKRPVKVYEVYDKITKPGEYTNFQKHKEGFIPVLAGEKAYDFYGLKAKLVSE